MKRKGIGVMVMVMVMAFLSCDKTIAPDKQLLFSLVTEEESGISFENRLTESDSLNYFTYPYIYMGGGVAIGDLNNDGLPDIYFTGNMVEDKLYKNTGGLKFEDITLSSGLGEKDKWVTGATMADVNGDGYLDIYVCVSGLNGPRNNLLYINNQDFTFTESAESYGVADDGRSTQGTFFDYDRDGDLDLFVANYPFANFKARNIFYKYKIDNLTEEESDRLYRNNGDNTFTDVTKVSGVFNYGLSLSATVGDFNQDGWPDLYVSNDFASPDYFYFNNGDGTFSNSLKETVKHTAYFGMGVDVADINNDGLLDFIQLDMSPEDNYRSKANMASMNPEGYAEREKLGLYYQNMYNSLQLNNGNLTEGKPSFSDIARIAGMASTDWSWSSLLVDLDNDGFKDVFVTNGTRREINNKDHFGLNSPNKMFGKKSEESLLERSLKIPSERIDNYVYKNNGDLTFGRSNEDWGLSFVGFSNGSSYADLDNDGDLDLVISNLDSAAVIFQNNANSMAGSNYLQFVLKGSENNKFGLGTKVELEFDGTKQVQELTLTRGFQSSVEPLIHFGLGDLQVVKSAKVTWPDGKVQNLAELKSNQRLILDYSSAIPAKVTVEQNNETLFTEVASPLGIDYNHRENSYNDFELQPLLPHKTSQFGPGLTTGDVNGDGLDDFFVGAAAGGIGRLFLQNTDGTFRADSAFLEVDRQSEDLASILTDVDNDGDLDLYVVSGGNEFSAQSVLLQDRLYINDGEGKFKKAREALPEMLASGGCVSASDVDNDGDVDLFVGGRLIPGNYPKPARSYLLINETRSGKVKFVDKTLELASGLEMTGMVTSSVWSDYDRDGDKDLIITGEWMPIKIFENKSGEFEEVLFDGLENTTGWWFSLISADIDHDGFEDLIAGNLGLNYKYQASVSETFDVYASDYDGNERLDIVLGYYQDGTQYPVRGKQCSSEQIPALKSKFKDYNSFAQADLIDIYTEKGLEHSLHYKAQTFASSAFKNISGKNFESIPLPNVAQLTNINGIISEDLNLDGKLDLLLVGNLFVSEVETPRNDAGIGSVLLGNGTGKFESLPLVETGFFVPNDAKNIAIINTVQGKLILVINNNNKLQAFRLNISKGK